MKRNLVLLAIAGVLVALAAGLWAARSNEPAERSPRSGEAVLMGSPGESGILDVEMTEPALGGPVFEEEQAARDIAGAPSPPQVESAAGYEGASPAVAGASIDRKIIQTASLSLQVKAVGEAFQEVGRIASAAGGFVASSAFSSIEGENEGEAQMASVTIRVPAVRFQEVLASLRGLAVKVDREQSEASDVTEEFSDLAARLRNLEATEAQYLEFLKRAKDIGEVLQVQDRLNAVRGEIEQVRGRMNLLENLSDMATVTVHLRPEGAPTPAPEPLGPDPVRAAQEAWQASLEALRAIASGVVVVGVFSWWLVPPMALLALVLWQTLVRRRRAETP